MRWTAALLLSLAVIVAGCGNEKKDSSSATSTTRPGGKSGQPADQFADLKRISEPKPCVNDPGVTDTEIKVGTIAIESGPMAQSFAPALDGIKARIKKANDTHELGDRKITLVNRDDTGDQTRNGEVARDLVEQSHVFGIIETSNAAVGSAKYLNGRGIPVGGWHVGVPAWSEYPNMFTFRQGTAADPEHQYTTRNAKLLSSRGATKVALIGGNSQSSALFIERIKKSIEQTDSKLKVVYENVTVPPTERDFTAEVQAIKDSGADSVYTSMDFLQNAGLSDGLAKAGVKMKAIVFPGGYDPRVASLPGVEGSVFGLEFFPFELKKPAFLEFDKWAPKDVVRGQVSFIGWLSGEIFIRGLKEAGLGCPTRKAFISNLRLVHDYDGAGAFDPVDLSKDYGVEFRCAYYVQVEHQKFVPQYGGKPFCGEPITLK